MEQPSQTPTIIQETDNAVNAVPTVGEVAAATIAAKPPLAEKRKANANGKKPIAVCNSLVPASTGFNVKACKEAIAAFVIMDEQPFRLVEGEGFKCLLKQMQPQLIPPSRRTVARQCFQMYLDHKARLKSSSYLTDSQSFKNHQLGQLLERKLIQLLGPQKLRDLELRVVDHRPNHSQ